MNKKVYSSKLFRAIGLMSGTSLDGVDAALIETDGYDHVTPLDFITVPYTQEIRDEIRKAFGKKDRKDADVLRAQELVTIAHIDALKKTGWPEKHKIDVIGFHGQTIYHAPHKGITIQIGDGQVIADALGIDVVADMRSNDVANGGEGAPLAPLYHQARAKSDDVTRPCVFLNIGGVANVTYLPPSRLPREGGDRPAIGRQIPAFAGNADTLEVLAFDTGPGNALMDDWMKARTGEAYDIDGMRAAVGNVLTPVLKDWLLHPYFKKKPPKSLDRDEWDIADFGRNVRDIDQISTEDGAATLLEFTAQTILKARDFMAVPPSAWYVCGGGRHNAALMKRLARDITIKPVEDLGWNGDATEAECFAYLAVRSLLGEPLSLPTTTGVKKPLSGGKCYKPIEGNTL